MQRSTNPARCAWLQLERAAAYEQAAEQQLQLDEANAKSLLPAGLLEMSPSLPAEQGAVHPPDIHIGIACHHIYTPTSTPHATANAFALQLDSSAPLSQISSEGPPDTNSLMPAELLALEGLAPGAQADSAAQANGNRYTAVQPVVRLAGAPASPQVQQGLAQPGATHVSQQPQQQSTASTGSQLPAANSAGMASGAAAASDGGRATAGRDGRRSIEAMVEALPRSLTGCLEGLFQPHSDAQGSEQVSGERAKLKYIQPYLLTACAQVPDRTCCTVTSTQLSEQLCTADLMACHA